MVVNTSDIIGAAIVTSLFLGVIFFFSAGQRKVGEKFDKESGKLKDRGFEITSDGIKIRTNIDLSEEDFVQSASHKAQVAKDKLQHQPGLVSFGQKKFT
ncbi:hypothetical protein MJO28_006808 [Puccinia striiformis f. sp. tritici]|uniref:Uncharacterized protein n=3 Tax=Puccinia striiformis TaxID=27350 RepID=A0A0L0V3U4_9BASI|nr:hypothetical protein Pst134EB_012946 [Puccinia striiformis f. sp. tritici]KAI9619443.1 hypothetical protein H4Q26_014205 [Puccinia striiformis f. sp. tritici PST-130]KNE93871.1 hypothetical protein PSTG_12783 [Puccinia striiformis f. sp. tritici PST-78]POW09932.1 hypothetical protein PSHT_08907 [Puccinia striiformis]KAI7954261.1 hypothetical protein MJO28_006808 [Puccinia striiformis f. sp. tritici]